MESYQLAWLLYIIGGIGCGLAAWFLFRRFGREWGHFFTVSIWVVLLTPYALDAETMTMAPAIFILLMDGLMNGFDTVKPITMLLLGVWLVALVLSLIFQLLTRRSYAVKKARGRALAAEDAHDSHADDISAHERQAREELLAGEYPIRAER